MSTALAADNSLKASLALSQKCLLLALKALSSVARGHVGAAEEALDALQAMTLPPVPDCAVTAPMLPEARPQVAAALLRLVSRR